MSLAEATALSAGHIEKFDPEADRVALGKLAAWCERFSPAVAICEPDCLYMDMTGLARLFGSEQEMATEIMQTFRKQNLTVRIALCETYAGAWALSHFSEQRVMIVPEGELLSTLSSLPIAALNMEDAIIATLGELGIDEIGQLLSFSREGLAARFNPVLLLRLDQAGGQIAETIKPHRTAPELTAEVEWEFGVADRFFLETTVGELLSEVVPLLIAQQRGILDFACEFHSEKEAPNSLRVRLYQASANLKHLSELAQLQLEKLKIRQPITKVRLLVCSSALLGTSQLEMFDGQNCIERDRQLSLLVDRLSSRLGPAAVLRPAVVADAQAECAYRYHPLTEGKKRRASKAAVTFGPLQRPLLLYASPMKLDVLAVIPHGPPVRFHWEGELLQVHRHWGPERIAVGWWRGPYVRREYYRVETDNGNRYWLFRRHDGEWFLHGVFD